MAWPWIKRLRRRLWPTKAEQYANGCEVAKAVLAKGDSKEVIDLYIGAMWAVPESEPFDNGVMDTLRPHLGGKL